MAQVKSRVRTTKPLPPPAKLAAEALSPKFLPAREVVPKEGVFLLEFDAKKLAEATSPLPGYSIPKSSRLLARYGTACERYVAVYPAGISGAPAVLIPPDLPTRVVPEEEYDEGTLEVVATASYTDKWGYTRYHDFVGCDPEVFAVDAKGNLVPSFEFLPPKAAGLGVYWDGYQAEFDTSPYTCMDEEAGAIAGRLVMLQSMLPKGCSLSLKNTWDIPKDWLESHSPEHTAFGCSPSRNAYDEKVELPAGNTVTTRSAGGHLHLSLPKEMRTDKGVASVTKALDAVLGVLSVALFRYWDTPQRRTYYGRAGEHRKTSYGVEYRVLSNAWLAHRVTYHLVFELARRCIGLIRGPSSGLLKDWMAATSEEEVRRCINTCDVALALEIVQRNRTLFAGLGNSLPCGKEWLEKMVFEGVHVFLDNPDTIDSVWTGTTKAEHTKAWALWNLPGYKTFNTK